MEQATALAERVQKQANDQSASEQISDKTLEQVRWAYRFALSRLPTAEELASAKVVVDQYGLQPLCRALLNCNEALFLP